MGEAACLTRSYSQPSESSRGFNEVNPHRCLGESISFGRFVSEPLSWEKWSSFSRNRYLEEAETYSKPGSVAKMKAYFEAHFKGLAAKKKAAEDQEDSRICNEEVECTEHETCGSDIQTPLANDFSFNVPHQREAPNIELASPGLATSTIEYAAPTIEGQDHLSEATEPKETKIISPGSCDKAEAERSNFVKQLDSLRVVEVQDHRLSGAKCKETKVYPENSDWFEVEQSSKIDNKNRVKAILEKELSKVLHKADGDHEKPNSKIELKPSISDIKRTPYSKSSKLSTSLSRITTPVRPRKECVTPSDKRPTRDNALDIRRLASKSVHVSTSIASQDDVIKRKSSPLSKKTGNENSVTPLAKVLVDKSTPFQTPIRASAHGVSRHKSATPQPETGWKKATPSSSFAGSRSIGPKKQSPSVEHLKASDSCGLQPRACTTFSPFNFRSEERAVKRREFFQRLREKEAEKMQQLEKTKRRENSSRRLLDSISLKEKSVADKSSKSSNNTIKKIGPTLPHLSKLGTKQSSLVRESCTRSLRRSSVKTDNSILKPEKNYRRPTKSTTILPSKNTRQENASPNIL